MNLAFFLILFPLIIIVLCIKYLKFNISKTIIKSEQEYIPREIIQTYFDKSKIPDKVYQNIRHFAKNYKHFVFDDSDCYKFISKYFGVDYAKKFNSLYIGAHKADFFRYCYLYIKGGIYLDIKTELIKPLGHIIKNHKCYTVLSKNKGQIYQGIIASYPSNDIFLRLLDYIMKKDMVTLDYHAFTKDFYSALKTKYKQEPKEGVNGDWYIFQEKCFSKFDSKSSLCSDGVDRYGLCCFVYDFNKPIIKTRYADYPWK